MPSTRSSEIRQSALHLGVGQSDSICLGYGLYQELLLVIVEGRILEITGESELVLLVDAA